MCYEGLLAATRDYHGLLAKFSVCKLALSAVVARLAICLGILAFRCDEVFSLLVGVAWRCCDEWCEAYKLPVFWVGCVLHCLLLVIGLRCCAKLCEAYKPSCSWGGCVLHCSLQRLRLFARCLRRHACGVRPALSGARGAASPPTSYLVKI